MSGDYTSPKLEFVVLLQSAPGFDFPTRGLLEFAAVVKKKDRASALRKRRNVPAQNPTDATAELPPGPQRLDRTRPWVRHLVRCIALMVMVLIVYSNSFQSGWVLDNRYIIQLDPRNKEASLENFKLLWLKDYWWPKSDTGAYRPLVSTSYWLNW